MLVLNRIIPLQHASVCEPERTGDICLSFSSVFFYWFRNLGRRMVLGTHPSIIQAILKPAKRPPQCVLGLPLGLLPDTHACNIYEVHCGGWVVVMRRDSGWKFRALNCMLCIWNDCGSMLMYLLHKMHDKLKKPLERSFSVSTFEHSNNNVLKSYSLLY